MPSQWLPRCEFYLRRLLQAQPGAFFTLLASCLMSMIAVSLYIQQWRGANEAEREWHSLSDRSLEIDRLGNRSHTARPVLSAFSNTQLVGVLNRVAEESKLPLDEVSFALDENANQPYLRYRVTLTVSATYPAIRRFLDHIGADQPGVSLDTIICSRDDITSVDLTCDLALSAFYRSAGHG